MKKESKIIDLIKSAGLDEPSLHFTEKVMDRVYLERISAVKEHSKSLINFKIISSILFPIGFIIILILIYHDTNYETGKYKAIFSTFYNLIIITYQFWAIIPVILSSSFILLLIDNYFNRRKLRKTL